MVFVLADLHRILFGIRGWARLLLPLASGFILEVHEGLLVCWIELGESCEEEEERSNSGDTFSRRAFLDASFTACLRAFLFLLCLRYLLGV